MSQSAEELYGRANPAQQVIVRDLILRMVTPAGDGDPVRSPVARDSVASDEQHDEVIDLLVDARLVTSDGDTVELAHEALTRAWPRLRTWLDEDVEGQRILRHLTLTADGWEAMEQPESELYRGARLVAALEWAQRSHPDLTPAEPAFLDASQELADEEMREAEQRSRHQTRANRQLRLLLGGAVVLLVVALIAGALAVQSAGRAETEAVVADARRVGAQAPLVEDVDRSLLLAVESVRLDDSFDTRASLLSSLTRNPLLIASRRIGAVGFGMDVSPDGASVAVGSFGGGSIHSTDTLDELATVDDALVVAFNPNGDLLAAAGEVEGAPFVRLLDPGTFEVFPTQLGEIPQNAVPWSMSWDAAGRRLAVSFILLDPDDPRSTNGAVVVWDVEASSLPVQRIDLPAGSDVPEQALSPDGSVIYVTSPSPVGFVRSYDVATGELLGSADVESSAAPALSPDGSVVAAGDLSDVVVLDATDLTELNRLAGHSGDIYGLEYDRDGLMLASASDDHSVVVWDVDSGNQHAVLDGHTGPVRGVAFSPDAGTFYAAGADQRLLVWDLAGDRQFIPLGAAADVDDWPGEALVAPNGAAVAYTLEGVDEEGAPHVGIQVLDVAAGTTSEWLDPGHGRWGALTWHPDSERFATTGADGTVRVWDWRTQELLAEQEVSDGHIAGLDYTGDGSRLVVGERDGRVFGVDGTTLDVVGTPVQLDDPIAWTFARSVGSVAVAVMSGVSGFVVVDVERGEVLHADPANAEAAALSPSGDRIAVVGSDGEVGLFDLPNKVWVAPMATAHRGTAFPRAWAPDGTQFATGGLDGRVLLWDGVTGVPLGALPAEFGLIPSPSFLLDSRVLMAASVDWPRALVHRWDTSVEHWIDSACKVAGRNLTEDEWREAFDERPHRETCPWRARRVSRPP